MADDGQVTRAVATLLHFALRNRMLLVYSPAAVSPSIYIEPPTQKMDNPI